jgi:cytochrome c-type biogenesis protein CcmH/NrfG
MTRVGTPRDAMNFCPGCGTKRLPGARFCAACGRALAAPRAAAAAPARPSPVTGFVVFSLLVVTGVGMWMRILNPPPRGGPPGSPGSPAAGSPPRSADTAALPEGHPPVGQMTLPEDVKTFIADLAAKTAKTPADLEAWQKLAQVQYRAALLDPNYYPPALGSFQHILEIDPRNADALRGVANVHYDREEYREAIPFYERYLSLRPDDPSAQTDLATMRLYSGEVQRAVADFRRIIAAHPTFFQAHYNLGIALHQAGDAGAALAAFTRAREVATEDRLREHVGTIIARLTGGPPAGAPAGAAPGATTAPGVATGAAASRPADGTLQGAVETFFRTHEIVGPRVATIEWVEPTRATVLLRDFPMAAMPPFAREKFTARIREALRAAKTAGGLDAPVEVTIADAGTRAVMETVRE